MRQWFTQILNFLRFYFPFFFIFIHLHFITSEFSLFNHWTLRTPIFSLLFKPDWKKNEHLWLTIHGQEFSKDSCPPTTDGSYLGVKASNEGSNRAADLRLNRLLCGFVPNPNTIGTNPRVPQSLNWNKNTHRIIKFINESARS